MKYSVQQLVNSLTLERLDENLFRGTLSDTHIKRVYGGKVLGEAIKAAQETVEDERFVHSIHAYFLREADSHNPVIYDVERSRDGNSFSARRVKAIQYGRPVLTMEASFHKSEEGPEYQSAMPDVPAVDDLAPFQLDDRALDNAPPMIQRIANIAAPFDFRPIGRYLGNPTPGTEPVLRMWMRTQDRLPADVTLHRAVLAYLSDYGLIPTLLLPAGIKATDERLMMASLDHAMWFHRPFRVDEWLLYVCEGRSSAGARGLATGRFYSEDGTLVASTAQEGLLRLRSKAPD